MEIPLQMFMAEKWSFYTLFASLDLGGPALGHS